MGIRLEFMIWVPNWPCAFFGHPIKGNRFWRFFLNANGHTDGRTNLPIVYRDARTHVTRPDTPHKMRLVCVLFTFENNTDIRTDGRTDTPSYRDATAYLKTPILVVQKYSGHSI